MVSAVLAAHVDWLRSEEDDVSGGDGGAIGGGSVAVLGCHALRGISWLVAWSFRKRLGRELRLCASEDCLEVAVLWDTDLIDSSSLSTAMLWARGEEGVRRAVKA